MFGKSKSGPAEYLIGINSGGREYIWKEIEWGGCRDMEYQMQRESCAVCETVFEGTKEQPIDLDFTLPDYCPDIERILKCRVTPSLTSRNLSADMLELDGSVLMSLYYLDAKKQAIRLCEHTMPFSCSFSWKTGAEEAAARVGEVRQNIIGQLFGGQQVQGVQLQLVELQKPEGQEHVIVQLGGMLPKALFPVIDRLQLLRLVSAAELQQHPAEL